MTDRELMQQALEALDAITYRIERDLEHDHEWAVIERELASEAITALCERIAQPEQEPFCYHDGRNIVGKEYASHCDVFPLYTAPPKRKPLTPQSPCEMTQP